MRTITRVLTIVTTTFVLLVSNSSFSTEENSSYSVGQIKNKHSKDIMLNTIKQNISVLKNDNNLQKTQYLTREQHQKQKLAVKHKNLSKPSISNNKNLLNHATKNHNATNHNTTNDSTTNQSRFYYSFSIYQGYAQLIEDYDEDGYYQTFSVTFDADVITSSNANQFDVYAELYLSKNGGPWVHYYSTDVFTLLGESEDDIYEVYTTLEQGYPTDEYDVLIDLYEVGYDDIVASYSSDDTNDLYAIPLESTDYDPDYVVVHEKHGGSSSMHVLLLLFILFITRTKTK